MADDPFPFQLLDVVDGALGDRLFQVGGLIDAVDKAKIDVVCFQLLKLPVDRALDLLEVERPAVSAAAVVGAKVDLEVDPVAAALRHAAIGCKGGGIPRRHIKVVDAVFQRHRDRLFGLLHAGATQ